MTLYDQVISSVTPIGGTPFPKQIETRRTSCLVFGPLEESAVQFNFCPPKGAGDMQIVLTYRVDGCAEAGDIGLGFYYMTRQGGANCPRWIPVHENTEGVLAQEVFDLMDSEDDFNIRLRRFSEVSKDTYGGSFVLEGLAIRWFALNDPDDPDAPDAIIKSLLGA